MLSVVIQIDGFDPAANAPVILRATSRDVVSGCHLDGKTWWPTIARLPTLRYDLFDGAFGGQITAPAATLAMAVEPWPDFGHYALADARLRLWTGTLGAEWAGYTLRFDGRISEQPALKDGQAQIAFAVDDRWLDTALLPTYAGTTGIEGPAALKGQPKPLSLGAPRYVSGTLVDSINSVFQVSFGPINAVEVALERLARFGPPVNDYPSYAALIAAPIARGTWATCLAAGLVRFGAPPQGKVSFLVQGDIGGPDGWARLPGRLIRRLAMLSGGTGKIDLASLAALDAARPYPLSLYLDQQTTARQLIQQLAASVNAVANVSWTGQLFVVPVQLSAPTITLAADGSSLPPVGYVEQVGIAAPWKKLAIGAERAWSVHAYNEIAFTAELVDLGAYDAATTYREGNIVQDRGSTWLYQNPVATKGNQPPALPTEEDSFWRVLARAGADGDDGAKGDNAPAVTVTPAVSQLRVGRDGNYIGGQTFSLNVTRIELTGVPVFRRSDGYSNTAAGFAQVDPASFSTTGPDNLTISAAGAVANMDAFGGTAGRLTFGVSVPGSAVTALATIQKVQDGAPGADGFIADSDVPVFVIECFSNGTPKPTWAGGSGAIRLTKGGGTITAGVTYSIGAQQNIASLTLNGATFSFAGLTADTGQFVINAIFNGVAYSRVISVKKVRDGSAAFRSEAPFSANSNAASGTGNTTVPQARTVTISGYASYFAKSPGPGQTFGAVGYLSLFWRNVTDNGPDNLLGTVQGSEARTVNRSGNAAEPDYDAIGGQVAGAFQFTSPSPDKQIAYRADFSSGGSAGSVSGNVALEIR